MRLSAWLTRVKFTLLTRCSTTGWTTDGNNLLEAELFPHRKEMMHQHCIASLVKIEQVCRTSLVEAKALSK